MDIKGKHGPEELNNIGDIKFNDQLNQYCLYIENEVILTTEHLKNLLLILNKANEEK